MKRLSVIPVLCCFALVLFAQGDVPAHHTAPPVKGQALPPILAGEQLLGPEFQFAVQKRAYELAAKISDVIYQQPCYCHCDRGFGHTSLRSCYQSTHALNCAACMQEVFYSYQMTKQHKTPTQIRAGIIRGEWQKVNLQTAASIR
jgi:hypothetical protein